MTLIDSINISRSRLIYLGFMLIVCFSSFAIHNIFLIPPTLILFFIGALIVIVSAKGVFPSAFLGLPLFSIAYFLISQTVIGAPLERYMGVAFALGYYVVLIAFRPVPSVVERNDLIFKFILYSLILLAIECTWRITNPVTMYSSFEGTGDIRWIYQYKFGGPMYSDSNVVGFHIMVLLFFIFYRESHFGESWFKSKLVILTLLILSFSRAAWVGAFLGWIYVRLFRNKRWVFYLLNLLFLTAALLAGYFFYLEPKIASDLSFRSKLAIIDTTTSYFREASISEIVFGIGFSNSLTRMGIYAHNFFMVFLIESGIIGLSLMILLFIQFILSTKQRALFILVPFCISTLSNTVTFIPYFFVIMALMYLDTRDELLKISMPEK